MRSRLRVSGVFSLAAVDLFASAMGAFIVITLVLMPDYQKEVRLEGHLALLESLAAETLAMLDEAEEGEHDTRRALLAARARQMELRAEDDILAAELRNLRARLAAPPAPEPEPVAEITPPLVTFRFLGLRTDATRILVMVDLNKYLGTHARLVQDTVIRALDSLGEGYEFGLLAFQQLDSGPRYHRWPAHGGLAVMDPRNRAAAYRFVRDLDGRFAGGSPLAAAFREAFASPAEALILVSDGLPNPAFNQGLPPGALIQDITLANPDAREIHAVTIGDYFKYKGTVEFMENLARANQGGFLALAQ